MHWRQQMMPKKVAAVEAQPPVGRALVRCDCAVAGAEQLCRQSRRGYWWQRQQTRLQTALEGHQIDRFYCGHHSLLRRQTRLLPLRQTRRRGHSSCVREAGPPETTQRQERPEAAAACRGAPLSPRRPRGAALLEWPGRVRGAAAPCELQRLCQRASLQRRHGHAASHQTYAQP
jgi:hypothetical protein